MSKCVLKGIVFTALGAAVIAVYAALGILGLCIGYVPGSFWVALPVVYWVTAPDWRKTKAGRALMMLLGSLAALFLLIIASSLFCATPFREVLRTVTYFAVLVAAVRLAVLLFQFRFGPDRQSRSKMTGRRNALTTVRSKVVRHGARLAGVACVSVEASAFWRLLRSGRGGAANGLDQSPWWGLFWRHAKLRHDPGLIECVARLSVETTIGPSLERVQGGS
ncbi:hypothetical protein [Paenarthrobacter ilicis]|uniref:putative phage holin n=1 Tax=Paenarthrobacter ilicis TaxID=43665 RepID=UPI0028D8418A|nr:hypothetical protein [Paenarthrobacter ilicis]